MTSTMARLGAAVSAVADADPARIEATALQLGASRRYLAPVAWAAGALVLVVRGAKLLVMNWRLCLIELVPAAWGCLRCGTSSVTACVPHPLGRSPLPGPARHRADHGGQHRGPVVQHGLRLREDTRAPRGHAGNAAGEAISGTSRLRRYRNGRRPRGWPSWRLGRVLRIVAEPEDDGRDGEFGAVVGGAFCVAGGEIAELFEPRSRTAPQKGHTVVGRPPSTPTATGGATSSNAASTWSLRSGQVNRMPLARRALRVEGWE
jgi:hypothetical protein